MFTVGTELSSLLPLCVQLEDQLEREKKARGDMDRVKRKLEQDLKQTQEAVDDMQRVKRELEEQLRK